MTRSLGKASLRAVVFGLALLAILTLAVSSTRATTTAPYLDSAYDDALWTIVGGASWPATYPDIWVTPSAEEVSIAADAMPALSTLGSIALGSGSIDLGSKISRPGSVRTQTNPAQRVAHARRLNAIPPLPRLSARFAKGRVIVNYCFASLPTDRHRRPAQLRVAVDNMRDRLPPLALNWAIKRRCGTIRQPVGPIKPPYVLLIRVIAEAGDTSGIVRVRVR